MCLLIHKPAGVTVERDWLEDFYKSNDDGFGFMWAKGGSLYVVKKANAPVEQFIATWEAHADKECIIHLRMRTHGAINYENTHPYPVITRKEGGPIWLAHNGVLRTGNRKNFAKSDTWHFINDYLRPLLLRDPALLQEEAFRSLLEESIGVSNRFAFMDAAGNATIINRGAGVEWRDMWLSNTYAWSAGKAGVGGTRYGTFYDTDWGDAGYNSKSVGTTSPDDWVYHYNPQSQLWERVVEKPALTPNVPAIRDNGVAVCPSDLFTALRFHKLDMAYEVLTLEAAGYLFDHERTTFLMLLDEINAGKWQLGDEDSLVDVIMSYIEDDALVDVIAKNWDQWINGVAEGVYGTETEDVAPVNPADYVDEAARAAMRDSAEGYSG